MTMDKPSENRLLGALRSPNGARFILYGAIGVFLGIIAPFNSGSIGPIWVRIIYWMAMIYGGGLISMGTTRLWRRALDKNPGQFFTPAVGGLILSTSIPITAMVVAMSFPFASGLGGIDILVLYFYVVTITVAVTIGTMTVDQSFALKSALAAAEEQARSIHAAHENQEGDIPPAAFASRLKFDLRQADILSLSADDHYLDVFTSEGREQIRCTVADAASELAPIDGRVIHRSHWVARSAIEELVRSDGRAFVRLADARELPVSRTRLRQLQEENWFPN